MRDLAGIGFVACAGVSLACAAASARGAGRDELETDCDSFTFAPSTTGDGSRY